MADLSKSLEDLINNATLPDRLCHCGTLDEALEKAKATYIQMAAVDCPIWAATVSVALANIAFAALVASGGGGIDSTIVNYMTAAVQRKLLDLPPGTFTDIAQKIEEKRRELHG